MTPMSTLPILSAADITNAIKAHPTLTYAPLSNPKWLSLSEISFDDPSGLPRKWEACERIHNRSKRDVDAVDVVAILEKSTSPDRYPQEKTLLLVLQFRPATGGWTLEFPSGLLDGDEAIEIAALRELHEETGYHGKVTGIGPIITYEPGITSSCTRVVTAEVDPDAPENLHPQAQQEPDEWSLQPVGLPFRDLHQTLENLQKLHSQLRIDSRLYCFAAGLHLAN
ncbi:NUDIX hydrolase domain-like protein [Phlyctochytrium arcticum]|nr:NUDIX hydrolase domain-like protein [Phlyctochytrium arcticum]KAI9102627.1 NUDIX hydrolase domain-like protein [Phlyctochytrium arcticum]